MIVFVSILCAFVKKNGLLDYSIEYVQKQYEILSFDASAASIYSDFTAIVENSNLMIEEW